MSRTKTRIYWWVKGAPASRPGGPWWYTDFPDDEKGFLLARKFVHDMEPMTEDLVAFRIPRSAPRPGPMEIRPPQSMKRPGPLPTGWARIFDKGTPIRQSIYK